MYSNFFHKKNLNSTAEDFLRKDFFNFSALQHDWVTLLLFFNRGERFQLGYLAKSILKDGL